MGKSQSKSEVKEGSEEERKEDFVSKYCKAMRFSLCSPVETTLCISSFIRDLR